MRTLRAPALLALCALLAGACRASGSAGAGEPAAARAEIARLLDDWHRAAARADAAGYLGPMAEDCVYLGTDASERWSLEAFRAFCEPYFARGVGWTYTPRERHVQVEGDLAWFDERLWSEKYGECRGTGVLRRREGAWRIVHYSLTFPVPNELAAEVVELIRGG
jgi:uncharacterized protein (TIGR02246 family)